MSYYVLAFRRSYGEYVFLKWWERASDGDATIRRVTNHFYTLFGGWFSSNAFLQLQHEGYDRRGKTMDDEMLFLREMYIEMLKCKLEVGR